MEWNPLADETTEAYADELPAASVAHDIAGVRGRDSGADGADQLHDYLRAFFDVLFRVFHAGFLAEGL